MSDSQNSQGYDAQTIEHFRARLFAMKVELESRIERMDNKILVEQLDGTEKKDKPQVITRHDALLNGDKDTQRYLDEALKRCEDGTYGQCVNCHGKISQARLDSIPYVSRDIFCQEEYNKAHPSVPSSNHNHSRSRHPMVERVGHPATV